MKKLVLLWVIAVAATLLSGCSYDAVASCESICEEGIADGCQPAGTNCEAQCAGIQAQYDAAREDARTAGCVAELNASTRCFDSADPCATNNPCVSEGNALIACFLEFCLENPSSPVCM